MTKAEELNAIIEQEKLEIVPFDEKGFSITPFNDNCLFIYCNESNNDICLYLRVAVLSGALAQNPEAYLYLLRLTGPASAYPNYSIGCDQRSANVWLSTHLSFDNARSDIFAETVQSFIQHAFELQDSIQSNLDEIEANSSNSYASNLNADRVENLAPPQNNESQPYMSESNDLMNLMSSNNIIWG